MFLLVGLELVQFGLQHGQLLRQRQLSRLRGFDLITDFVLLGQKLIDSRLQIREFDGQPLFLLRLSREQNLPLLQPFLQPVPFLSQFGQLILPLSAEGLAFEGLIWHGGRRGGQELFCR